MLATGFHEMTAVPVNCPSLIASDSGSPESAEEELPLQLSVTIPPARFASVALPLCRNGRSAVCCSGQAVLLFSKLARSVLRSWV